MPIANEANAALCQELERLIEAEAKRAASHSRGTSHVVANYKKALHSIRHCPDVITSGDEARKLKGIGNFIGQKIQGILTRQQATTEQINQAVRAVIEPRRREERRENVKYKPAKGKLPWYVVVALQQLGATCEEQCVDHETLLVKMKELGYVGEHVNLRAGLPALVKTYQVVAKSSMHGHLYLTMEGIASAQYCNCEQIISSSINTVAKPVVAAVEFDWKSINLAPVERKHATLEHAQDEWEIVLLLDHREMLSRRNRSVFERKLLEANVNCEVRSLHLGDMIWIARREKLVNGRTTLEEFVLDVIVERKAVSDLSMSIIDKRYTEQKQRLAESGLRYVIYLVEGSLSTNTSVGTNTLQTSLTRTRVQNNFLVHHATTPDETVAFLASVHWHIAFEFKKYYRCSNTVPRLNQQSSLPESLLNFTQLIPLTWQPYADFSSQSRKKAALTTGDIYQMMLLQTPGISAARAKTLSASQPTFMRYKH
ncbi:crossover junction endonuclease MUS81 [Thraustotheca clavata]|uniref:Crossover junction endonuclease MUS81 n=1 Tax=Thraustotheca clavata TaxID=74557 RepID=A0A1W0A868_9STRA|nr:crossover junction endonuclease MUS81 [Thraustotheca clavata]